MRVRVLGSAAGGGFPQWNCGCSNCVDVRAGNPSLQPRSQESVAVSADGDSWFLLNASPEVRAQIEGFPGLHPREPRHSPIAGILLTNGDLDHCLGLLSLRESQRLSVYSTARTRHGFTENNVLYRTLQRFPGHTSWAALELGVESELRLAGARASGLTVQAIALPGQAPLHLKARHLEARHLEAQHLEARRLPETQRSAEPQRNEKVASSEKANFNEPHPEDNIGLLIREPASGAALAYFPGCARIGSAVLEAAESAQCLFFDGTFWSDDELIAQDLGERRASDMAHVPISGDSGSLAAFARARVPARYFIHINNTNPILREDSRQRRMVREAGWQVAHDGLDLTLGSKGIV